MATCSEVFQNEEFDFSGEPVVNRKKTMRKVLKALAEYRRCKRELSEEDKRQMEEAIRNDDYGDLIGTNIYKQYKNIWKLEYALKNALNAFEREIIEEGYLTKEKHNWVRMTMKLKVSKTTYYKGRREAFSRLAHALGIVVYD